MSRWRMGAGVGPFYASRRMGGRSTSSGLSARDWLIGGPIVFLLWAIFAGPLWLQITLGVLAGIGVILVLLYLLGTHEERKQKRLRGSGPDKGSRNNSQNTSQAKHSDRR